MTRVAVYDPKRTQVAQSLVDFGRYFETIFGSTRIGGSVPRRPVLVVPEDMSTDGGRRARQSITLQPDAPGAGAVACGWIDIPSKQAMIRTWDCLAGMHRQRFPGRPFDVDGPSYQTFFRQCLDLLKTCGLAAMVEDTPVAAPAPLTRSSIADLSTDAPAPAKPSGATLAIVAVASFLLGALVGGIAVWLRLKA
jgi:hypothetical protein